MSNQGGESDATGARGYGAIGGSFGVNMPGIDTATAQVAKLTGALNNLQQTMQKIQSSAAGFTAATNNITKGLNTMSGSSGGSTTYGKGNGGVVSGIASSLFGPATQSGVAGVARDIALFPARFIQGQVENNRNVVNAAGSQLGMQSFASNTNLQSMMGTLSKQMGGVMGGNPQDLMNLMTIGSRVGAGIDWRAYGQGAPSTYSNQPRAAGFLESVRQGQLMNPGADVGSIAGTVGGFLANSGAQRQSAMLTGGAFSMIGSGNRSKSISEWAEGILKWFMNQRPGAKRGKPFNYGEMMSQNFPGSNMDAWFEANGVPQDMRDYFWTYALGKASSTGTTGGEAILGQKPTGAGAFTGAGTTPPVVQQNPIFQRLAAGNAATRQSFNLGGKLTGMYGNMEQANRWFAELMGQMQGQVLPGALASGALSWMQYLPDEMREMLMSLAERTNIGAAGAGILGWAGMTGFDKILGPGDVGDVGDYGPNGTSGLAGMHPDMRKKVAAMMRANPNLSITSGHRDLAKQQTLKRKGGNRVSGRPSAHTRGMAADIGPASQYGWLVQNAGKFGLKSGVGAGEPWHVGMGDTGDIEPTGFLDVIKNMFSGLVGAIGGIASGNADATMTGIAGGTTGIMKLLMGLFAQPDADLSRLDFRDVYSTMVGATKDALKAGLPVAAGGGPGGSGGSGSGGTGGTGGGGGGGSQAGQDAARALFAGGFTKRADLEKIVAIAKRESGWNPTSENPNGQDKGLMQINNKAHASRIRELGVTNLLDAVQNARVAHDIWSDSGNSFMAWNFSEKSVQWGQPYRAGWAPANNEARGGGPASPFLRTNLSEAASVVSSAGITGLGDMPEYWMSQGPRSNEKSVVFVNTFNLQGGAGASGANGGIDVKRAASQIADTLEQQMKQRMSRYN